MKRMLPLVLLTLVACAKKSPQSSGSSSSSSNGITDDTNVPNDHNSKYFADYLIKHNLRDFEPGDTGSVELIWKDVNFGAKNHFQATSRVTGGGEVFDCEEKGDWTMPESAESETVGVVQLNITDSNCPGRARTGQLRIQLRVHGDTYDVLMR